MRDYITNKLLSLGCEQNGNIFSKTIVITQPGSQMIINGHHVVQQPQQIHLKSIIKILEDGYIENADGSNHEPIYWIDIIVEQEDDVIVDQMEGLYSDNQDIFDYICSQIFKNS